MIDERDLTGDDLAKHGGAGDFKVRIAIDRPPTSGAKSPKVVACLVIQCASL